jgi:hypothetical protein
MQSNIVDMFSPEITLDSLFLALNEKSLYNSTLKTPITVPLLKEASCQEALLHRYLTPLMATAVSELHTLKQQELSFIQKFESILRIVYRFNRNNPELILLYQEMSSGEVMDAQNTIFYFFNELHRQVQMILKLQAYNDGVIRKEGVMEELIFFILGQILQNYQIELASCCRDMMEGEADSFPSEEDMIDRFYTPLAQQLKGMIAS